MMNFVLKNEEFCIKHEELCIKSDEFCSAQPLVHNGIYHMSFAFTSPPNSGYVGPRSITVENLVSSQWKNPDFLLKKFDFLLKNVDF